MPYVPGGGGGGGGVPSVNGITSAVTLAVDNSMTLSTTGSTITLTSKGGSGGVGVTTLNGLSNAVTIAGTGAASVSAAGSTVTVNVAPNGFPMASGTPTYQASVAVGTGAGPSGTSDVWNVPVMDTSTWDAGAYIFVCLGLLDASNPQDTNSPLCAATMIAKWGWWTAALPGGFGTGPDSTNGNHQRYIFGPATGYYAPPGSSATAYKGISLYLGGPNQTQIIAEADNSVTQTIRFQCVAYKIA